MHILDPKYKKVQHINRPLIKGELLWVPCIIEDYINTSPLVYMDPRDLSGSYHVNAYTGKIIITPILWPVHHNHYHADMRFVKTDKKNFIINKHPRHIFTPHMISNMGPGKKLQYILLPVINPEFKNPSVNIQEIIDAENATIDVMIMYPSIKKGKCPHQGFNLEQVKANAQGEIICPMHGLRFKCKHLQEN